jgi:hypothetical protein
VLMATLRWFPVDPNARASDLIGVAEAVHVEGVRRVGEDQRGATLGRSNRGALGLP